MIKTTLRLEDTLKQKLDAYCRANNLKMNDAIRQFIAQGIEQHQQVHHPENHHYHLLINQKRAIHASVESILLLRKIINDKEKLEEVQLKVDKILSDGWIREKPDE